MYGDWAAGAGNGLDKDDPDYNPGKARMYQQVGGNTGDVPLKDNIDVGGVKTPNIHKIAAVHYGTMEAEHARYGCCGVDWVQIPGQTGDTAPITKGQIPGDHGEAQAKRQRLLVLKKRKEFFLLKKW